MRIVIDMQAAQCGSRHRGIGRYSMALARAMVRFGPQHEFLIALSDLFPDSIEPIRAAFDGLVPQGNIRVWSAVGPTIAKDPANRWRRQTAAYLREAFLSELKPDIVHIASLMEGFEDNAVHSIGLVPAAHGTAVTFYDAIPLIQHELYLQPHPVYEAVYRDQIEYLRRADLLLVISESSGKEAIEHLGFAPERCANIAAAADDVFGPLEIAAADEAALRQKLRLPRPFIMYSGATDDRKNHLRLIQAYARLPKLTRQTYQLALVGRIPPPHRDRFERCVQDCGLSLEDVVITGGVTDLELAQLYNLCHLFVFPSWHEGFGLPALEALSCGAAVIGSNTTSVPEVLGRDDALFDPFDVDAIAGKIHQVLVDEDLRQSLRRHATEQAQRFSWERSARVALDHMENWFRQRPAWGRRQEPTAFERERMLHDLAQMIGDAPGRPSSESELVAVAAALVRNLPAPGRRPQLFVDLTELIERDSRSGIQRVVRGVLTELVKRGLPKHDIVPVAASSDGLGYRRAEDYLRRYRGMQETGRRESSIDDAQPGDIFLGLDFQPFLTVAQAEYLQTLRHRGVQLWFLLHDLLPITQPDAFPPEWEQARIHAAWLDVLAHADGVVCVSRTTADEFLAWLDCFGQERSRPLRVAWCHNGANVAATAPSKGLPPDVATLRRSLAGRTSFLVVATLEPRKRHVDVLDAADAAWAAGADFNVVFVGRDGWNSSELVERIQNHLELDRRLFWLASASDELLDELYSSCDCLIAASNAEGFGLPIVEAALHGLPCIARDIPVFREIATAGTEFFDDTDAGTSLTRLIGERSLAPRVSAAQRPRIVSRTWQEATEELLSIIEGGSCYKLWAPAPTVKRFWASHPKFGTDIGQKIHHELVLRGEQTGCGLYGPYVDLDSGTFDVIVRGRASCSNPQDVTFDIVLDQGRQVLAKGRLHAPLSPLSGELARARIHLERSVTGLEVRLWVRHPVDIAISMVEIRPHVGSEA